ncbi:hypothetical protein [Mycobacterium sp. E740]|uniref:hypothetical protein n=1 Tax=Mycobacterium sp. E740 TaxID=1834149 RepID=UPI000A9826E7|nr:hypothetical protein [Mycobacterium sp. E740]
MLRNLSGRRWLFVAVCAAIGMLASVLVAFFLVGHLQKFRAQATLAMLPASYIPTSDAAGYWEVLNHGQATRSAAIVLGQPTWLQAAAAAAGVPASELALSAGAVRDTTLIEVTIDANSAAAAEAALSAVLYDADGAATAVSGPFRLEVVKPPAGSAQPLGPSGIQVLGTAGIVGLVLGAGIGILISWWTGSRPRRGLHRDRSGSAPGTRDADTAELDTSSPPPGTPSR